MQGAGLQYGWFAVAARLSAVIRRTNSPMHRATTTSRIGHMMVSILYSLATERRHRVVAARSANRQGSRAHLAWRYQYRTALLPDDRQIAFVSTADSGHFNLYVAELAGDRLSGSRCLVPEHTSSIYRYYYAHTDHTINPSWTPDGQHLLFVSNRKWLMEPAISGQWQCTRPEILKNLQRRNGVARAAAGRTGWPASLVQQLSWPPVATALAHDYAGCRTVPLSFGEFDRTQARFSPDGSRIGYISNEEGNTSLWVQEIVGGARTRINASNGIT